MFSGFSHGNWGVFLQQNWAYGAATVGLLIVLFLLAQLFSVKEDRFLPKRLLTKNEEEFFARLVGALPDCYVFPQVAFRAFMRPGVRAGDKNAYQRQLGKIGSKHCDFLVCNKSLDILAIVELDDRSHVTERDRVRDALTGNAGYVTIRYESRIRPSVDEIRDDFRRLEPIDSAQPNLSSPL